MERHARPLTRSLLLGEVPVRGVAAAVWSGWEAYSAFRQGNYGKAAWEMAGMASFGTGAAMGGAARVLASNASRVRWSIKFAGNKKTVRLLVRNAKKVERESAVWRGYRNRVAVVDVAHYSVSTWRDMRAN